MTTSDFETVYQAAEPALTRAVEVLLKQGVDLDTLYAVVNEASNQVHIKCVCCLTPDESAEILGVERVPGYHASMVVAVHLTSGRTALTRVGFLLGRKNERKVWS